MPYRTAEIRPATVAEIVELSGVDRLDDWMMHDLNNALFDSARFDARGTHVVTIDGKCDGDEAVDALAALGLRPATVEQLLAHQRLYPDDDRTIIALGTRLSDPIEWTFPMLWTRRRRFRRPRRWLSRTYADHIPYFPEEVHFLAEPA